MIGVPRTSFFVCLFSDALGRMRLKLGGWVGLRPTKISEVIFGEFL